MHSQPPSSYPEPQQLVTLARFWDGDANNKPRFTLGMEPRNRANIANCISETCTMADVNNNAYVFYREGTNVMEIDVSDANGDMQVIAANTLLDYEEVKRSNVPPGKHTLKMPGDLVSDWALSVSKASP